MREEEQDVYMYSDNQKTDDVFKFRSRIHRRKVSKGYVSTGGPELTSVCQIGCSLNC